MISRIPIPHFGTNSYPNHGSVTSLVKARGAQYANRINESRCQIALSCHNQATPKVRGKRKNPCLRHRWPPGSFLGFGPLDYSTKTRASKACWHFRARSWLSLRSSHGGSGLPVMPPTTIR